MAWTVITGVVVPWAIPTGPLILPTIKPPVVIPTTVATEAPATITVTVMPLVAISRLTAVVVMIMMPVSAMTVGMEVATWTVAILSTAVTVITPVEVAIPVGIHMEAAAAILTIMPVSTIIAVEPIVSAPAEGPLSIPVLGATLFAALAVMVVEVAGTVTYRTVASGAVSARMRTALVAARRATAARPEASWARTAPAPSAIAPGMIVFFCHQCP